MKKRMLVTTIALVLVIAVALTTSSLAWFSSSSSVSTQTLDFTAATATGTNLVLGNFGATDVDTYGNTVALPSDTNFNPVQGKVSFVGIAKDGGNNNKLALATNPFYASSAVVQESGYDVAHQKVTFTADGSKYLAGGFNFTNVNRYEISGGVTADVTITLTPATSTPGTTHTVDGTKGTVKRNFVVYQGGWKGAGEEFDTESTFVVYRSQDIALIASIRIAVCGAANVLGEGTFSDSNAKVYGWGEKGVILNNTGSYELTAGANQKKYVPDDPTGSAKTYLTDATDDYANTISDITYADGAFTFSYNFTETISPNEAGSIAFVIWMDGWDESALPGLSTGTFKMGFKLSK